MLRGTFRTCRSVFTGPHSSGFFIPADQESSEPEKPSEKAAPVPSKKTFRKNEFLIVVGDLSECVNV